MLNVLLVAASMQVADPSHGPMVAPCPIGTLLRLAEAIEPELSSKRESGGAILEYRTTLTIRPVDANCNPAVHGFDYNNAAARLDGGMAWFRYRDRDAPITAWPIDVVSRDQYQSTGALDPQTCDPTAAASTTFGPFSSCLSLHRDATGSILRVASGSPRSTRGEIAFALKPGRRYEALSAGSWLHDVVGEIALIRTGLDGLSVVDIYRLVGS